MIANTCVTMVQFRPPLANEVQSPSTWRRLEQRSTRQTAIALHDVLLQQFIASFTTAPCELNLDFDVSLDFIHSKQEARFFNGF